VQAETAPPYAALFQQAEASAPRLAEAAANVRVAEGLAGQAGLLPNPSVGVQVENIGPKSSIAGLAAQQETFSVAEPIEFGGKRGARIRAGVASVNAAEAQNRRIVVDFGYDLAIAYVTAEAAEARTNLYRDALNAAADDLRAAQALVNAGREAPLRGVQAEAASTSAQADLQLGEAEFADALAKLSVLVAAPNPYTAVSPSLLPSVDNFAPPSSVPPANYPAIAVAAAERDAAAQRVDVERTRAAPTVTASLGLRRITGEGSTLFVGGIVVPLPLFDDNRGNIAAALAELTAADVRLNAARIEAETGWRAALVQANAAEARSAAARNAEMAADQAYRLTRTGYEAGRTPLSEVLTARRNLTDAQLRTLDARVARVRAEAELARLSGRIPFGGAP